MRGGHSVARHRLVARFDVLAVLTIVMVGVPALGFGQWFHYPSEDVKCWAKQFLDPSGRTETMSLLQSITLAIKKDCIYMSRSEKGVQSPSETLASRRGSCRDFAVLMMEAARSLGFAARFVSGYIFIPSAGTSRTVGGGSTHAWIQAYLPGSGWIDFDPTNSIVGNRNLIRVVVAWEPSQVLPLWGTFIECVASTVFRTNNSFYGFVEVPD